MRVLVLSHMYPRAPHPAGGIFVHEQVRALRARGIDARVMAGDPFWVQSVNPARIFTALRAYQRTRPAWTEWDGVPVLHFPYLCGYFFRPSLHSFTYRRGVKRALAHARRQFAFDLIHAHTSFLDGAAGATVGRSAGCPLMITEHTGPFNLITRNALMRRVTRRAVRAADCVFAVSESLKQDMLDELGVAPETIGVMPNGVDIAVFHPGQAERRADDLVRALWVGHHVEIKCVERLVHAFARVSTIQPRLRLSLVGDGPDRARIEAMARELGVADRVAFHPGRDRAGVAQAMRTHDFLVISSSKETFGLVALEALACGIPVLSTACGGPEGLITDASLGLIVDNSREGLERGLSAMAEREATSPARLHAHVRDRLSWDAVAVRLIGAYQRLLESSKQQAST